MAHSEAPGLKTALLDELKSLSPSEHNTWVEFLGREKDISKGRLISSKAIFSIVYNPDGSFKKYKARLVARGDMLKSKSKDTYSGTVSSSQATRFSLFPVFPTTLTATDLFNKSLLFIFLPIISKYCSLYHCLPVQLPVSIRQHTVRSNTKHQRGQAGAQRTRTHST